MWKPTSIRSLLRAPRRSANCSTGSAVRTNKRIADAGKAARKSRPRAAFLLYVRRASLAEPQVDVRLFVRVERAERPRRALQAFVFRADLVVNIGREIVEAIRAVVAGDIGDDGEIAHVLEIDHGAGNRAPLLVEDGPGKIARQVGIFGLLARIQRRGEQREE